METVTIPHANIAIMGDDVSGAIFSNCGKYRYALWRKWDLDRAPVMFIGLNPSTANHVKDDPTIRRVCAISKNNGYGGVYMMNCFPYISTDPQLLYDCNMTSVNEEFLKAFALKCGLVVFAWGNFDVVKRLGVDLIMSLWFPRAKALHINKNGSPKHPLYCRTESRFVDFKFNNLKP